MSRKRAHSDDIQQNAKRLRIINRPAGHTDQLSIVVLNNYFDRIVDNRLSALASDKYFWTYNNIFARIIGIARNLYLPTTVMAIAKHLILRYISVTHYADVHPGMLIAALNIAGKIHGHLHKGIYQYYANKHPNIYTEVMLKNNEQAILIALDCNIHFSTEIAIAEALHQRVNILHEERVRLILRLYGYLPHEMAVLRHFISQIVIMYTYTVSTLVLGLALFSVVQRLFHLETYTDESLQAQLSKISPVFTVQDIHNTEQKILRDARAYLKMPFQLVEIIANMGDYRILCKYFTSVRSYNLFPRRY